MCKFVKKTIEWCGKELTIETGRVAKQADGAVLITYGETTVLCTAVANKEPKEDIDFLPLTVNYKEMTFAAGKIPGGFFKREGRPSAKEVLTSRLIDRPIRPLFPSGFSNEIQVICSVFSYDGENDPDIVAMIGASAALMLSGIPFQGPIAAIRVGLIDDKFVFNPSVKDYELSDLDLSIAGTKDSVLMVESGAKELNEDQMLKAIEAGHKQMQPVLKLITSLQKEVGKKVWAVEEKTVCAKLTKKIKSLAEKDLSKAYTEKSKQLRNEAIKAIKQSVLEQFDLEEHSKVCISSVFKSLQEEIVRGKILKDNIRIDGRDPQSIRDITTEVSVLHRTHGSALFTRGETQAIVVTTLGSSQDEQMIDSLDGDSKEHFMLHYNFPSYSVGEVSPQRGPGRREIGHGKLAWRAIFHLLPKKEEFPYTIRTVSEITECNGSSSMATICGASLALMDAGVPIKKPVAGIAMGLIKEAKKHVILSDIMGDEDALGDMDFKVAGTQDGITALQMDIKISGITPAIMKIALDQAKEGRLHILKEMSSSLSASRQDINKHAPSITSISVPKDKIGHIIGPGGKMIKEICEKTGAKIDIDDNGIVSIAATDSEASQKAMDIINGIIVEAKVGEIYDGVVNKILDFGAVVTFMGNKEGLLHISEISNERVENVADVLKEGQKIKIKVIGIDERKKKLKLSMKQTHKDYDGEDYTARASKPSFRGDSRNRGSRDDRPRGGGSRDDRPRGGDSRRDDRPRGGGSRDDRPPRGGGSRDDRPPRGGGGRGKPSSGNDSTPKKGEKKYFNF